MSCAPLTIEVLHDAPLEISPADFLESSNGRPLMTWQSDLRWNHAVSQALRYRPLLITARDSVSRELRGLLPLSLVSSRIFGRFLVSLPYVNSAGVWAADQQSAHLMIDQACRLADQFDVRYLELRHERQVPHPQLNQQLATKVHMRLELPSDSDQLWSTFKPKVRNQIRKGEKGEFRVAFGDEALLEDFYVVFSRNMRDLGTPVFPKRLFRLVLETFGRDAELCVLYGNAQPVAAALLVHDHGVTQVPSASSLRQWNPTNVNMWMYWQLLQRSIERGQKCFDFGRSSVDSNTFRFKKQWGAEPHPAIWQYYVRSGDVSDMRPENAKYRRAIAVWKRLPVWITRWIGPPIVRGIP